MFIEIIVCYNVGRQKNEQCYPSIKAVHMAHDIKETLLFLQVITSPPNQNTATNYEPFGGPFLPSPVPNNGTVFLRKGACNQLAPEFSGFVSGLLFRFRSPGPNHGRSLSRLREILRQLVTPLSDYFTYQQGKTRHAGDRRKWKLNKKGM